MEISRKRLRSDCSPCSVIQNKVYINQRKMNENDASKMRLVEEKTMRNLFEGARKIFSSTKITEKKLSHDVVLHGNGRFDFRSVCLPKSTMNTEYRKAKCCIGLNVVIQDSCDVCDYVLCEHCGYSCDDCGSFLCRSCVSFINFYKPICEACAIFN